MMGRPKKAKADRRDNVLRIRLTEAERKALERAAKGQDVSAWARTLLLAAAG